MIRSRRQGKALDHAVAPIRSQFHHARPPNITRMVSRTGIGR